MIEKLSKVQEKHKGYIIKQQMPSQSQGRVKSSMFQQFILKPVCNLIAQVLAEF